MEQTRVAEGLWLPRTAQINLSVKVLLFGGGDYNQTFEWSDYKHFSGNVSDYKLDAPKTDAPKVDSSTIPKPSARRERRGPIARRRAGLESALVRTRQE